jgi:hypothetical protein
MRVSDLAANCGGTPRLNTYFQTIKNPAMPGFLYLSCHSEALLDLGFLVYDVFANDRVEFPDFHLFRHIALVLGRGVVMTGTGTGDEFDFVTHVVFS